MAKVVRNSLKKEPLWENISIFWRFCQILVNGNDDDNDDNGDDDDDDDDNDVYLSIFSVWPLKAIQPLVPTLNHQSCKIISTLWRPWYYPQLYWKKRNTNKHNVVKIKSCIGSCVMMMRNTETDDVTAFSVPRRELPNYWPGEHSRGMIPVPISVIASRRGYSSYNGNRKQDLPIMAIGNKMPLKRVHNVLHILFLY